MTGQTVTASVKVDGDKLAEALRRVTPLRGDSFSVDVLGERVSVR